MVIVVGVVLLNGALTVAVVAAEAPVISYCDGKLRPN